MDLATFNFDYTEQKLHTFGLLSDIHLDSPGHDKQRFEADMDALASKGARVFMNGDIFDAIMPTDRKRYSRSGDKAKGDAQINERVDYAVARLKRWADHIDYLGFGNHEASVVKYNNTDILAFLARELNHYRSPSLPPIQRSGYVGFINLCFSRSGSAVRRFVIYRSHGLGGNSPVTLGTISLNRLYTTYVADLYWLGHSHTDIIDKSGWNMGVSPKGKIVRKRRIGVITAGYQRNFQERSMGDHDTYRNNFPEERFHTPTGLGCATLTIDLAGDRIRANVS